MSGTGSAGPSSPTACTTSTTQPSSARMVFQAKVRIRKVTKNGRITKPRIRFLNLPALKAITYASGNASNRQTTVATAAYPNERRIWS